MKHCTWIASAFLISLSLSCTRQMSDKSFLTLSLPSSGPMSSKLMTFDHIAESNMSIAQSTASTSSTEDAAEWNTVLNPSTYADINCYMVAIAGPESNMRRNICTTTTGQSVYVGRWIGGLSAGQQISIEVPSGAQREIMVVGFKSVSGACTNFKTTEPDKANLSEPHILGKVTQNLNAGDVAVTVNVSLSASTLKISDCSGPDFNLGEGSHMYFGSGTASLTLDDSGGDSTIDISTTEFSSVNHAKYAMINDFSLESDGVHIDTTTAIGGGFSDDDEVMIMVMGGRGKLGPNTDDYEACGYRAWPGRYMFTKIIPGSTTLSYILAKGTFLDTFSQDANGNGTLNDTLTPPANDASVAVNRLRADYGDGTTPFCRIQIIKIPHVLNLTLANNQTLTAPLFTWDNGGGVLAFRVAHNLSLGSSAVINMTGKGYPAVGAGNGDGITGSLMDASPKCRNAADTMTGAGCANSVESSTSGGGGGHGNIPQTPTYVGPFALSGGYGFGGATGGDGAGDDCGKLPGQTGYCFGNLSYKMFMGGAGGGNDITNGTGGAGGGIIFVAAKNYVSASGHIRADGDLGQVSKASGGGAGGSIHFIYATNDSYTNATGSLYPMLDADGGIGSSYNTYGAGGGGAGRIQTVSCTGFHYDTTLSPSVVSSSGGGPGSGTTAAVSAGKNSLVVSQSRNCN